jgi:hypothetical protein
MNRNLKSRALFAGVALLSIAAAAGAAPGSAPKGNACDQKLITVQDVSGILRAPITSTAPAPGDPQSCVFKTADYTSIAVALRPGKGKETVEGWAAGKMGSSTVPLPDVGDRAVWVPDLQRVYATKGDLLCAVSARTTGQGLADPSLETLRRKLGVICGKIFSGYKP